MNFNDPYFINAGEIARRRAPGTVAAHRYAAALEAGRTEAADGIPLLAGLARDESLPAIVRATAVRLLAGQALPVARAAVVRGLSSPEPLIRLQAAEGAAGLEDDLRLSLLAPLLEDTLLAIRVAAARSLAAVPEARFEPEVRAQWKRAIEECEAVERVHLERAETHLNLGNLYRDLGRRRDAEREFRRSMVLDPTFVPAVLNLADLWRADARDDRADSLLTAFLSRAPESADAHFARGLTRVRLKRSGEALADLERAAALRPADARIQTILALALHGAGRSEEALGVLRQAAERRPGNPGLLYVLATLHRDLGRRREAEGYAQSLLRLDPENPVARALVRELALAAR